MINRDTRWDTENYRKWKARKIGETDEERAHDDHRERKKIKEEEKKNRKVRYVQKYKRQNQAHMRLDREK